MGGKVDSEPSDPEDSDNVDSPKTKSSKPKKKRKKPKKDKKPKLRNKMSGDDEFPFDDDLVEAGVPDDDLEEGPGLKEKKKPRKKRPTRSSKNVLLMLTLKLITLI